MHRQSSNQLVDYHTHLVKVQSWQVVSIQKFRGCQVGIIYTQVNKETCSILVSYDGKCRFHPYQICYKVVLASSSWETLHPVQCQTRNHTPDRGDKQWHSVDKQWHSVDMCACRVTQEVQHQWCNHGCIVVKFVPTHTKPHNKWMSGYVIVTVR